MSKTTVISPHSNLLTLRVPCFSWSQHHSAQQPSPTTSPPPPSSHLTLKCSWYGSHLQPLPLFTLIRPLMYISTDSTLTLWVIIRGYLIDQTLLALACENLSAALCDSWHTPVTVLISFGLVRPYCPALQDAQAHCVHSLLQASNLPSPRTLAVVETKIGVLVAASF